MYTKELNFITEKIKEAYGLYAVSGPQDIRSKSAFDLVTEVDVNIEKFLTDAILAAFPGDKIHAEEMSSTQEITGRTWVIDPIDGTANYARGLGESAISVALAHRGEVRLGVVYNPYREQLFTAVRGGGAYLNDQPICVSEKTFAQSLFCTAASLYRKDLAETCFRIMEDTYGKCNDFRRFGSAALEICYLAAGKCDLYFEMRLFPWDYAAAQLILREAGGIVRDFDGKVPSLCHPSLFIGANCEENYAQLSAIVHRHMKAVPYGRD